ncbi:MAG: heparinase II/III family protein [Candidatus Altiarchaeota archaeon]|nr:heparinase II/III family protein [Candidatus Altiarchaeota archaeon]
MAPRFLYSVIFVAALLSLTTGCMAACYTIEICGNTIDDDCDGLTDEAGCISVNSRITQGSTPDDWRQEYWATGSIVDWVDFGYIHWSAASGDTYDPDGDQNDRDDSFGEHNGKHCGSVHEFSFFYAGCAVEWDFNVPEPGYYLLSFFSWDSDQRQITPSYYNGQQKVTLPNSNKMIDLYLLHFDTAGPKRIYAHGNDRNYLFHSRLFKVREDPVDASGTHPRLGVSPDTLSEFRQRINTGWIKLFRDDTIGDADYLVSSYPLSDWETKCDSRGHEGAMADLALAYLATGDSKYATYGVEALKRLVNKGNWHCGPIWSYLSNGELGLAVALGYDAFSGSMTAQQRGDVIRAADKHLNYLFISSIHAEHRGDGNYWWSDYTSNNWNAVVNGGGLGTAGLAFKADDKYAQQWIDQGIKTQKWFLEYNFDKDGSYTESFMYAGYGLSSAALFFDALLQNEGVDLVHYDDDVISKAVYNNLYFFEPSRWDDSPFDDQTRWGVPATYEYVGYPDSYWFLAARENNDGVLQRFIRMVYGDMRPTERYHDYAGYLPRCLLSYGAVAETPVEEWGLPLGKAFPEFGRLVMRTGFEDTKDYYFAMQSGLYGSHGHADQSGFIIHALGRVLVDDSQYGTPSTSYHNAILVDGQGQKEGDGSAYGGSLPSFIHTVTLDYARADSTEGYLQNSVTIDYNMRNVLFVRPDSAHGGYFVIADNIKAPASHTYDWGLHHQTNSHSIESLGNNNYRFKNLDVAPFNTAKHFSDASLEIQFASPASTTYTTSGDKLIVTPASPAAEEHFTVLLYPTDSTHTLPSVAKINNNDFSGFDVGGDLVLYNRGKGLRTYDDITTDAELVFARDAEGLRTLSLFRGGFLSHGGLAIGSSIDTNLVLRNRANIFNVSMGDEVTDAGTTILSIGGVQSGAYTYTLDGATQGDLIAISGSLNVPLTLGKHELTLELKGGGCAQDSDCTDSNQCTYDLCKDSACINNNANLDRGPTVGLGDIIQVICHWATAGPTGDVDSNGNVGLSDVLAIISLWGNSCPL